MAYELVAGNDDVSAYPRTPVAVGEMVIVFTPENLYPQSGTLWKEMAAASEVNQSKQVLNGITDTCGTQLHFLQLKCREWKCICSIRRTPMTGDCGQMTLQLHSY